MRQPALALSALHGRSFALHPARDDGANFGHLLR
jgi:hypothetical protein